MDGGRRLLRPVDGLDPALASPRAAFAGAAIGPFQGFSFLPLVFDVFGDKEVLDAYDEAKRHQRDTEQELKQFEAKIAS